jgi:Transposase DDE domain
VVTKDPQQRGFKPQRKRWAVERTSGWLMMHRRLVRDYETNPRRSRAMIHWAMIDNMSPVIDGRVNAVLALRRPPECGHNLTSTNQMPSELRGPNPRSVDRIGWG